MYGIVAVDDMHFNARDFHKGFVRVQAEELTVEAILKSLREGRYYSSQGPEIHQMGFDGETLRVEFSPVKRAAFMTNTWYVKDRVRLAENGEYLTCAEYKVKPRDKWVRFEATDESGKA